MLIRALCLLLLLAAGPASSWAAGSCCQPAGCCEDESSGCPVLPNGTCALAEASRTPVVTVDPADPLFAPVLSFQTVTSLETPPVTGSRRLPRAVPRYLLLGSLRN